MQSFRLLSALSLAAVFSLAACSGGTTAPASTAPPPSSAAAKPAGSAAASPAASASAKPAASAQAAGSAAAKAEAKPSVSAKPSLAPAAPGTILAAYSELTPINTPLWAAVDTGIFKKNGLNVDARLIESSLGVGALMSDEVKFAAMGGSETLAATVEGADLVVIAVLSPVYPYKLEVVSSIKTPQDLKGKKLGISRIGSSSDSATRAALKRFNLDPDKDVQLVQVGSLATRMAALTSGALDGAVAALPDTVDMEKQGNLHPLLDLAAEKLPAVNNTLVARRAYINANKETTQKYVDSVVEGMARMKKDKGLMIELIKKYLKDRSGSDQALDETFNFYANSVFRIPPAASPELFADAMEQLAQKNPRAKQFDLNKLIDNSFVQDADKRGVGKS